MSQQADAPRCSTAARDRGDPPVGTAPSAARWLLLEQEAGWARNARASVAAPPDALAHLDEALAAASARLELIRRPGRALDEPPPPAAPVVGGDLDRATRRSLPPPLRGVSSDIADSTSPSTASTRPFVGSPDAEEDGSRAPRWCVLDLRLGVEAWGVRDADGGWGGALAALADPLAADAVRDEGVLLVCAHGRHDVCCAVRGRPVAAALAAEWPRQVWECSHLGGDRFAANVALLPDGALYGFVDPDCAVDLVRAHRARTPDLDRLRGVAGRDPREQAALIAAAPLLGEAPWDRRLTVAAKPGVLDRPDGWRVIVRMGKVRVRVSGHDELSQAARLTCAADTPKRALVPVVDAAIVS